jgi:hypothetical protein
MDKRKRSATGPTLTEVQERFRLWRENRERQTAPIPQQLWQAACAVARQYSVGKVSRALRLDHRKLKEHAQRYDRPKTPRAHGAGGVGSGFVEVEMSAAPAAVEWVMEVEDAGGRKLKISMRGVGAADAAQVAGALWREGT